MLFVVSLSIILVIQPLRNAELNGIRMTNQMAMKLVMKI